MSFPRRLIVCVVVLCGTVVPGAGADQARDVDGLAQDLFRPSGAAGVLLFVASDCPISNGYAPEIQKICGDYRTRKVGCTLVYEDVAIETAAVRAHRDEYQYKDVPAVIDRDRAIARRAGATVTPQTVVLDATGVVRYRGRIDNQYAALGKPRRVVTVHDLRDALDAVLAGKSVPHRETQAFGCFISPKRLYVARASQARQTGGPYHLRQGYGGPPKLYAKAERSALRTLGDRDRYL